MCWKKKFTLLVFSVYFWKESNMSLHNFSFIWNSSAIDGWPVIPTTDRDQTGKWNKWKSVRFPLSEA